jgi:hypothetical protein
MNYTSLRNQPPHREPLKNARYPVSVTIALGVLCSDGIVLAADSEEGDIYPGDIKTRTMKIGAGMCGAPIGMPQISAAVSGAGWARYLDAAKQKILPAVYGHPANSADDIQAMIEPEISDFYTKHVMPFFSSDQKPELSVMVARQCGSQRALWSTDHTTVSRADHYAALGVGSPFCHLLMDRFKYETDVLTGALIAGYVVSKVKEAIGGCSRPTNIVCLRNGFVTEMAALDVRDMDKLFEEFEHLETGIFYNIVRRNDSETLSNVPRLLRSIKRRLGAFIDSAGI